MRIVYVIYFPISGTYYTGDNYDDNVVLTEYADDWFYTAMRFDSEEKAMEHLKANNFDVAEIKKMYIKE